MRVVLTLLFALAAIVMLTWGFAGISERRCDQAEEYVAAFTHCAISPMDRGIACMLTVDDVLEIREASRTLTACGRPIEP